MEPGHDLVNALECVLAVGASLSPDDRTSLVRNSPAVLRHKLAVALHVTLYESQEPWSAPQARPPGLGCLCTHLLEVVGKLVEVLVVGEQRVGLGTVKVVIPDADKGEDDWQILVERGVLEVLVHLVPTLRSTSNSVISGNEKDDEDRRRPTSSS